MSLHHLRNNFSFAPRIPQILNVLIIKNKTNKKNHTQKKPPNQQTNQKKKPAKQTKQRPPTDFKGGKKLTRLAKQWHICFMFCAPFASKHSVSSGDVYFRQQRESFIQWSHIQFHSFTPEPDIWGIIDLKVKASKPKKRLSSRMFALSSYSGGKEN